MRIKEKKQKIIILNIIIVLCWMGIVFTFSNQVGKTSVGMSTSIATKIVEVFHKNQELNPQEKAKMIRDYNLVIRKLAHYSIYLVGGIVLITSLNVFTNSKKKMAFITILIGFLYACSDEIHQYFVSERTASYKDVLIDTAGVITGVILYLAIIKILEKYKEKKVKKEGQVFEQIG